MKLSLNYIDEAQNELSIHPLWGDSAEIRNRSTTYYLRGLEIVGNTLPEARVLYEWLKAASDQTLFNVLNHPVVRVSINEHLENIKQCKQEDEEVTNCVDVFEYILCNRQHETEFSSTGSLLTHENSSLSIWNEAAPETILKQRFKQLFGKEISTSVSGRPAILRELNDEFTESLKQGHALLYALLPELANSVMSHTSIVAVIDTEDKKQWTSRSRQDLCQNVSTHAIPSTIFLSPTPLRTAWHVAEALLHEAVHKKLSDIVLTRSIFRSGFDSANSPTIRAIWNRSLSWNSADWSVDRALFAFHVYVHLALFFTVANKQQGVLSAEFGAVPKSFQQELKNALDRATYLGSKLASNPDGELGEDGKQLVAWLLNILSIFEYEDSSDVVGSLLLDCYDRETDDIKQLLLQIPENTRSTNPTDSAWGSIRIADHIVHSEIVAVYRTLRILGERDCVQFSHYDGDHWSLAAASNANKQDRAALFASLRHFVSSTLRAAPKGIFKKAYKTRHSKTLLDHLEEMVAHCGRHKDDLVKAIEMEAST